MSDLKDYRQAQRRAKLKNRGLLLALALVLSALWCWSGQGLSPQERRLAETVRAAQGYLYDLRVKSGSEFGRADDPHNTGFIGLEWSPLSTTLGALPAKRTSCDPRWAVVIRRWMEDLELQPGDAVAVYSSSSFPAMTFNALCALESLQLRPILVVSLGASTWGANDPLFPWPLMERELRRGGYLRSASLAYTPGGEREIGGGLAEEAIALMKAQAAQSSVPLVVKGSLEEVIDWKMGLLKQHSPKALISIGGSEANMGSDEAILSLAPGLHRSGKGGDGVIGRALDGGYPVIHLLNMEGLAAAQGIPFDAAPGLLFRAEGAIGAAAAALALFAIVLAVYKRWSF